MSIQKKGDIYYVVLMYRDAANKKKYKWIRAGTSIREAQKLERQLKTDMDRGEVVFSDKITLEKFLYQWLDIVIKPRRRSSTYMNYKFQINNIVKNLGHIELTKLKAPQIQAHYNSELERPLKMDKNGNVIKTMSPTAVRLQHSILTMALDKAVEWKLIPKNPCDFTEPPEKNKPKNAVYSPEQVQKAIDIARDTNLYLPVMLGFLCGLRRGEICGLRWDDIDFESKSAFIRHSLDRNPETGELELGPTKTDESEGIIPLPKIVVEELRLTFLVHIINMERFGPSYQQGDYVWAWEDGRPHDPDYLYHAFIKLLDKHGLPRIRLHDMRHTHATLLLRSKIDTKIVSRKLRHKKASFTADYYQHVQRDMQKETADAMDKMFGSKPESFSSQKD